MATVKVTIAVLVNPDGTWGGAGCYCQDGEEFEMVTDRIIEPQIGSRWYDLEAEVEVPPETTKVIASVTQGNPHANG